MTQRLTKRRILDMHLLLLDQITEGSQRRELEMAVDAVVTFNPAYAGQFWKDVRLYGIDEAKMYLLRFVDANYQSPDDLANDMNAVSEVIERIHDTYEANLKAVLLKTNGR